MDASLMSQSEQLYNLNYLAEVAVNRSKMKSKNNGIRFEFCYSSRCNILCNKTEIIQAIIQIINNSLESFENQNNAGRIIVLTERFSNNTGQLFSKLEIINNGAIIPKNIQADIFEPSFSTKIGASGLGLSIGKKLIEKNGGVIEFQSPCNFENSRFEINNATMFRIIFKNPERI